MKSDLSTESRKSKEEKKVLRKQLKASHTLLKHEGVCTTPQPTKSLVIANGGLGNGVSREELTAVLQEMGEVEKLLMPPHKPYAFVTFRSEDGARKAHANLNGWKLQCGESSITLYLSYVDSVKCKEGASVPLPEGLALVEHFVSPEEEAQLLNVIDWSPTQAQKSLKHRRVKHYGFEFRYDINNVDKDKPLAAGLPDECVPILQRCVEQGHTNVLPDQLTVNQYESGQGIPPHVDTHSAFEDTILSLSLGAKTVMEFRHPDGRVAAVVLPERSLLVMKGESRYLWSHGITPRKVDMVPAEAPRADAPTEPGIQSNLTLSRRGTRTSFTFRKIRHEPCHCAFPSACDSQGAPSPSPGPSLPSCPADAARLEEEYVHRVYSTIASHFSDTRHTPWPRVCHFLSSLPSGSVLADVGCGNGKYLGVNADLVTVGCDRSTALVQICAARGYHAFVSDALSVPLRTASCDACISIAVIHHFSTAERRLAAVKELVRLLKPGGQALIYVWAFEQEYNKQKSKYLKQIFKEDHGEFSSTNLLSEKSQKSSGEKVSDLSCHLENSHKPSDMQGVSRVPDARLSVHTNRTAFTSQDLLVPWHLKGGKSQLEENPDLSSSPDSSLGSDSNSSQRADAKLSPAFPQASASALKLESSTVPVFHRYYHVFQQGELEHLCAQVSGVKVKSSYHDQGNWCVVLQKE
ncbi:alkylated DNA repair protein alkB homolog 8 isoform X2 [Oryzias latipes]|uniref:alkylated DNA repair protein alkB homolog 8 isoform X2 n=1 Tax=Oryzias latipes TaxID=8090 RepID=UPI0009DB2D3A|nr:alkylated DNA repair protein alkB homolog 8 isoform X2 [Oryzias latipes]